VTIRLAVKSLALQPVRSAVLACGFGAGIAAMAGLLGIGEVILEQSHAPALQGGGDVRVSGQTGELPNARFVTRTIAASGRAAVVAPSIAERVYMLREDGETVPVFVRAGIPSLERALGDPETADVAVWRDTAADREWAEPDPAQLLRAMDRFHRIPAAGDWEDSWAEWMYFNGRAGDAQFYLSFTVGPRSGPGRHHAWVRLQLDHDGTRTDYSRIAEIDEAVVLAEAPDLQIGENRVTLDGMRYTIELDLLERTAGRRRVTGVLTLDARPGHSMPPFEVRGAGGWISGYGVPVLAGALGGRLRVDDRVIEFDSGQGYHDHNWGFWEGVTWRWGKVAGDELSFLYGRIIPPARAADASRLPGLLVALGPDGPAGFATSISIEETEDSAGAVSGIVVRGRSPSLDVKLELEIEETRRTRTGAAAFGGAETDFIQMRARYHVAGRVGSRDVEFSAAGSAETFRGPAGTRIP